MPQLHHGALAGLRLSIQVPMCNKTQCEAEEGVCEVCVFLGYADVHTSIRRMEGANQEASVGMDDTVI